MKHAIPMRLNLCLLLAVSLANMVLLYTASHAPWWGMLAAALLFSLSNNTAFSLLHEAVHGVLAPQRRLNRWGGRLAAAWFPTGLAIQRAFHLTHHRYNRSEAEQFDVLHPHDVRWLKYAQWYSIYSGFYWAVSTVGVLLYALTPRRLRRGLLHLFGAQGGIQTGARPYVDALDTLPPLRARLEIWGAAAFHTLWFAVLDLNIAGWLACYGAFALQWSALQYTDHAFSPLNGRDGAWNLAVPGWLRAVFLNYHLHLAHHQYPTLPWTALPQHATPGPRFHEVWLACLRGPRAVRDFPQFRHYPTVADAPHTFSGSLKTHWRLERHWFANQWRFARRHRRYGLIALMIAGQRILHPRRGLLLVSGYCFLQAVDDIMDGDRPWPQPPVAVADALIAAWQAEDFADDELGLLARDFHHRLRHTPNPPQSRAEVAQLLAVMRSDAERAAARRLWPAAEIDAHHRRTFSLSFNLLLAALGSHSRADRLPELMDVLGWCSTVRDLRADLAAGIINIPAEVWRRAGLPENATATPGQVLAAPAVRQWLAQAHRQALALSAQLVTRLPADNSLDASARRIGTLFARSVADFAQRRFQRLYPGVAETGHRTG